MADAVLLSPTFPPGGGAVMQSMSVMGMPGFDNRIRKSGVRKTVDYHSTVIRHLEDRLWQRDERDKPITQPDSSYFGQVTLPVATPQSPIISVTTKFVRASTNKVRSPIFCTAWVPDGRRLVTGAASGEFTLWNGTSFNFESILQAHDCPVRSMHWSHSGKWMVTTDDRGLVKYWQTNFNNVHTFQAHSEAVRGSSFSPTDTKLATCSDDCTVRIWDFIRCAEEHLLRGHGADVKCLDWHSRKSLVVSGSKDSQQPVVLWDPKSGQSVRILHAHKATVMDVKWNRNGNWLATASRDNSIKLYDIRMMKEFFVLKGHKKEVNTISWHPVHETLFASGGSDGAILFWNVGSQKEIGGLEQAHEGFIWSLSWHPIGHILCSGSNDHTSKFWCRNRPGEEIKDKYNTFSTVSSTVSFTEDMGMGYTLPGIGAGFGNGSGPVLFPPPAIPHHNSAMLPSSTWQAGTPFQQQREEPVVGTVSRSTSAPLAFSRPEVPVLGADIIAETFADKAKAEGAPQVNHIPPQPTTVHQNGPLPQKSFSEELISDKFGHPPPQPAANGGSFPANPSGPPPPGPELQQQQQPPPPRPPFGVQPEVRPGPRPPGLGPEPGTPTFRGPGEFRPHFPPPAPDEGARGFGSRFSWHNPDYHSRRTSVDEERDFRWQSPHQQQNPYVYRRPSEEFDQRDIRLSVADPHRRLPEGEERRGPPSAHGPPPQGLPAHGPPPQGPPTHGPPAHGPPIHGPPSGGPMQGPVHPQQRRSEDELSKQRGPPHHHVSGQMRDFGEPENVPLGHPSPVGPPHSHHGGPPPGPLPQHGRPHPHPDGHVPPFSKGGPPRRPGFPPPGREPGPPPSQHPHSSGGPGQPYPEGGGPGRQFSEGRGAQRHFPEGGGPGRQFHDADGAPGREFPEGPVASRPFHEEGAPGRHFPEEREPRRQFPEAVEPRRQFPEGREPRRQFPEGGEPRRQFSDGGEPRRQFPEVREHRQQFPEGGEPRRPFPEGGRPGRHFEPGSGADRSFSTDPLHILPDGDQSRPADHRQRPIPDSRPMGGRANFPPTADHGQPPHSPHLQEHQFPEGRPGGPNFIPPGSDEVHHHGRRPHPSEREFPEGVPPGGRPGFPPHGGEHGLGRVHPPHGQHPSHPGGDSHAARFSESGGSGRPNFAPSLGEREARNWQPDQEHPGNQPPPRWPANRQVPHGRHPDSEAFHGGPPGDQHDFRPERCDFHSDPRSRPSGFNQGPPTQQQQQPLRDPRLGGGNRPGGPPGVPPRDQQKFFEHSQQGFERGGPPQGPDKGRHPDFDHQSSREDYGDTHDPMIRPSGRGPPPHPSRAPPHHPPHHHGDHGGQQGRPPREHFDRPQQQFERGLHPPDNGARRPGYDQQMPPEEDFPGLGHDRPGHGPGRAPPPHSHTGQHHFGQSEPQRFPPSSGPQRMGHPPGPPRDQQGFFHSGEPRQHPGAPPRGHGGGGEHYDGHPPPPDPEFRGQFHRHPPPGDQHPADPRMQRAGGHQPPPSQHSPDVPLPHSAPGPANDPYFHRKQERPFPQPQPEHGFHGNGGGGHPLGGTGFHNQPGPPPDHRNEPPRRSGGDPRFERGSAGPWQGGPVPGGRDQSFRDPRRERDPREMDPNHEDHDRRDRSKLRSNVGDPEREASRARERRGRAEADHVISSPSRRKSDDRDIPPPTKRPKKDLEREKLRGPSRKK